MTYFGCVNKFAQHVYFLANLKYANKLLKHMSNGYIHTCLLWVVQNEFKKLIVYCAKVLEPSYW